MSARTRRLATTAAGTVLAGAGLLAAASPAQALNNPVVVPAGNITSGSTIKVNLSGLNVNSEYYVSICDGYGATGAPSCDQTTGEWSGSYKATATTGAVTFKAVKSFVAPGHGPSTPSKTVNCKNAAASANPAAVQCYVVVTEHKPATYTTKYTAITFN